jgi:hypothetical protein
MGVDGVAHLPVSTVAGPRGFQHFGDLDNDLRKPLKTLHLRRHYRPEVDQQLAQGQQARVGADHDRGADIHPAVRNKGFGFELPEQGVERVGGRTVWSQQNRITVLQPSLFQQAYGELQPVLDGRRLQYIKVDAHALNRCCRRRADTAATALPGVRWRPWRRRPTTRCRRYPNAPTYSFWCSAIGNTQR